MLARIVIYEDGDMIFYNENDEFHRIDGGPAAEWEDSNGYKTWYMNGKCHRTDGPAIEYASGDKEWWIDGKQYSEEEFNKIVGEL